MTSENKEYLIREAFRRFYPSFLEAHPHLDYDKQNVAESIMRCKTGELGYNIAVCEECGTPQIHSVSCNNRCCPCCQAPLEEKWALERNTELIEGIAYYHVVFTMPHELNKLIKANMVPLLSLLFKAVQSTIMTLCADKKYMGVKPGLISVLHTWGQQMYFHPHIHVCLSGGGVTSENQFIETRHKGFLIPEKVLATMFRGKYMSELKALYNSGSLNLNTMPELRNRYSWKEFINLLYSKNWIPFVKETFNGRGNAIQYLARYSFRTAISNSRIVSVDDKTVTFRYKDYQDEGKTKVKTVDGQQFVGLFLQHVLPKGFNRMRYSGFLTNCNKARQLKLIHKLRNTAYNGNPYRSMKIAELLNLLYKVDICACPLCNGRLSFLPRGKPINNLPPHILSTSAVC